MDNCRKARRAALAAIGSLADLLPPPTLLELRHRRMTGPAADARDIAGDFRAVGRDIERAMKRLRNG